VTRDFAGFTRRPAIFNAFLTPESHMGLLVLKMQLASSAECFTLAVIDFIDKCMK
jgi:hypothetical protein